MAYRLNVNRSTWNGVGLENRRTVPKLSTEKPPRCSTDSCDGMFPLDTHPVTDQKVCSACYMEGRRELMAATGLDDILLRQGVVNIHG